MNKPRIGRTQGSTSPSERSPSRFRRFARILGISIGIWSLPGVLQAIQEVSYAQIQGAELSQVWFRIVVWSIPKWWPWILATPLVIRIARRWPIGRPPRLTSLAVHASSAIVLGFAHILLVAEFHRHVHLWRIPPSLLDSTISLLWGFWPYVELLAYSGILAITSTLDAYAEARDREVTNARLRGQLAEAQLATLRSQLQPHFLFNTLNAISVLMREDLSSARTMLLRLSDLLRTTLEQVGNETVLLDQEIETVTRYLEIERVRFADRLKVVFQVNDETRSVPVPNMLLQPLAENAVKHGIGRSKRGGEIRISAVMEGDDIVLAVEDDGAGFSGNGRTGLGLANTRERLRCLYPQGSSLSIRPLPERGTRVEIRFPSPSERSSS